MSQVREYHVPTLTRADVNREKLQSELKEAPNNFNAGVSWVRTGWVVYVFDRTSDADIQAVIDSHDPNTKTAEQSRQSTDDTAKTNFLREVEAHITQNQADLTALQSATLLTDLIPIMQHLLEQQAEILKAQRATLRG